MQEQLAWADGLFAVGGRVTATTFLLSLKPVAIGDANATSFVLQANSVREESCAGASFKKSPAVLHNEPGAHSFCSHRLSVLTSTLFLHPLSSYTRSLLTPPEKKRKHSLYVDSETFAITIVLPILGHKCLATVPEYIYL